MSKQNKGEISELYAFLKLIYDRVVHYADENGNLVDDNIIIFQLNHEDKSFVISNNNILQIKDDKTGEILITQNIKDGITDLELIEIRNEIILNKSTFSIKILEGKKNLLNIMSFKSKSFSKSDLIVSFKDVIMFHKQGLGVKSHFGNPPTIINSSKSTNFIYKINNLSLHQINNIQNNNLKVKATIAQIYQQGGLLTFLGCENTIYDSTLKKIDSLMPSVISNALLLYYMGKIKYLKEYISTQGKGVEIEYRLKDFIKYSMLGIFPTKEWNGNLLSNGCIVINNKGDLSFFHSNKDNILKTYFYLRAFFDTPSMTRHNFGYIYKDVNSDDFLIKLNLQIRLSI